MDHMSDTKEETFVFHYRYIYSFLLMWSPGGLFVYDSPPGEQIALKNVLCLFNPEALPQR